jgi:Holliday junction resolvase RusA-like endonuclease
MSEIKLYLDGVPGQKGRPQFARTSGGVRTFSRAKTVLYEARLKAVGRDVWSFAPLECPIKLTLVAVFPIAKSWPKWRRVLAAIGKLWHVGKPDLDNVIKIACDGLNEIIWKDDSQVCWIEARKQYGEVTGLWLTIETIDDTGAHADDARARALEASQGDPE